MRRGRQRKGRIARIYVEISDGRQEDDGDALARNPAGGRKVEVTEQKTYQSLDEVKAKLAELGIPTDVIYQLEYYKGPLIEAEPEKSE